MKGYQILWLLLGITLITAPLSEVVLIGWWVTWTIIAIVKSIGGI